MSKREWQLLIVLAVAVALNIYGNRVGWHYGPIFGGCTPAERQTILSAEEAICTVPRVLRGEVADDVAIGCAVAGPVASALVKAAGDAGAKP